LKGVGFSARKYVNLHGNKISEREGVNNRQDGKKVLDSFEAISKK